MIARVLELRRADSLPMAERRRDLICDLRRIARKAEALDNAAGLGVARATMVEIGKIQGVYEAPAQAAEPPSLHILEPPLTEEAWLAEVHTYLAAQSAEPSAPDD